MLWTLRKLHFCNLASKQRLLAADNGLGSLILVLAAPSQSTHSLFRIKNMLDNTLYIHTFVHTILKVCPLFSIHSFHLCTPKLQLPRNECLLYFLQPSQESVYISHEQNYGRNEWIEKSGQTLRMV